MPSEDAANTGFRMRACFAALGYLIEANLEYSQRSLSPSIQFRNIVSYKHPSMQLIAALSGHMYKHTRDASCIEMLWTGVVGIMRALMDMLRDGTANVHDVNDHGESVAHVCIPTQIHLQKAN
jgi:hypothetical protein